MCGVHPVPLVVTASGRDGGHVVTRISNPAIRRTLENLPGDLRDRHIAHTQTQTQTLAYLKMPLSCDRNEFAALTWCSPRPPHKYEHKKPGFPRGTGTDSSL